MSFPILKGSSVSNYRNNKKLFSGLFKIKQQALHIFIRNLKVYLKKFTQAIIQNPIKFYPFKKILHITQLPLLQ
jgi:hypothetical protein